MSDTAAVAAAVRQKSIPLEPLTAARKRLGVTLQAVVLGLWARVLQVHASAEPEEQS